MADRTRTNAGSQQHALHVATHPARFRLLERAVVSGPFTAAEAAAIAGMPKNTGTARTTHAGALCEVGLLGRDRRGSIRFFATPKGEMLYRIIKHWIDLSEADEHTVDPASGIALRAGSDYILEVEAAGAEGFRLKVRPR